MLLNVIAVTIINGHLSAAIVITHLAIYSNTRSQLIHSSHLTECVKRYFQYQNDKRKTRRRGEIVKQSEKEREREKGRRKEED